jgi:site-specific recombinase XerD
MMEELLKNISSKDFEKLKLLLSIIPKAEPKEIITLRVFVEEYSNLIKQNRSKAYYISVTSSFKHLKEYYGERKAIQEIGLKEIENFATYLQQKVNKTVSLRRGEPVSSSRGEPTSSSRGEGYRVYFRTLKAAFNKAVDWGYVNENYFIKVKLPKRQKLAPVFITSDQLSMICDQIDNEVIKDTVIFAFHTGMRRDEIVNLRWKNVDLHNNLITVGDETFTTKGRKQRFIPISDDALEALLRRKSPPKERRTSSESTKNMADKCRMQNGILLGNNQIRVVKLTDSTSSSLSTIKGFVFCKHDGTKYTGTNISRVFRIACRDAGFNNAIHFHSLRHSFASNLVQKGVPLYTIKELLGHSSISTTEIYSHLNMESLREAIKTLDVKSEKKDEERRLPFGHHPLKINVKTEPQIYRINSGEMK